MSAPSPLAAVAAVKPRAAIGRQAVINAVSKYVPGMDVWDIEDAVTPEGAAFKFKCPCGQALVVVQAQVVQKHVGACAGRQASPAHVACTLHWYYLQVNYRILMCPRCLAITLL
jgi:hypothetical protein